jgi:hypothetical protein
MVAIGPIIHLLEAYDIGMQFTDHGCNTTRITPAIHAYASVYVVGRYGERSQEASLNQKSVALTGNKAPIAP